MYTGCIVCVCSPLGNLNSQTQNVSEELLNRNTLYRVYWEVPAELVKIVPWVNLSQNNKKYPSLKLNSYGDKNKRSFKGSAFVCHVESMSGNPVENLPHITVNV
jgi:hypothetical protein